MTSSPAISARARKLYRSSQGPLIAFGVALVVSTLALIIGGYNPGAAYSAMIQKLGSVESLAIVINKAVPLFFSAMAVSIGFRMGVFNIGVEGQYLFGAAMGGVVGAAIHLPGPLHVLIIMITAMTVSMGWALIPAWLNVQRKVNIVISTIMLNAIAISVIASLSKTNMFITTAFRQTRNLPESGRFPNLNTPLGWIGIHLPVGTQLLGFTVVAIAVGIVYHKVLTRTRFGFDVKATGINPVAARFAGINPKKMIYIGMAISGALAGLVGMATLMEEQYNYKVGEFPPGWGFAGIAVALLARDKVPAMAIAAIMFGVLDRASLGLSNEDVPKELAVIMQGLIILSVVVVYEVIRRKSQARAVREAAELLMATSSGAMA